MKRLILAITLLLCTPIPALAFLGLFEPDPPEVMLVFNKEDCGKIGQLNLIVRNKSDEPLAAFAVAITIYRPETSRVAATFKFGTDQIIQPQKARAFCVRVPWDDLNSIIYAKHPNWTPLQAYETYGDTIRLDFNATPLLADAILQVALTGHTYGLPY